MLRINPLEDMMTNDDTHDKMTQDTIIMMRSADHLEGDDEIPTAGGLVRRHTRSRLWEAIV